MKAVDFASLSVLLWSNRFVRFYVQRQEFWIHQYFSVIFFFYECRERFLFYMQHPLISDAEERCSLIVYAYDTSKIKLIDSPNEIFKMTRSNYANIMTAIPPKLEAKDYVNKIESLKMLQTSRSMMPVSHFVNFSRAAVEHANDPDVIVSI